MKSLAKYPNAKPIKATGLQDMIIRTALEELSSFLKVKRKRLNF
jgi:hypothetical protein